MADYSFGEFEVDDIGSATQGRIPADPVFELPPPLTALPAIPDVLSKRYGVDFVYNGDFVVTAGGDLLLTTGLDGLRGALIRALITGPGEVHWDAAFGVGVPDFLNAAASAVNMAALKSRIRDSLLRLQDVDEIEQLELERTMLGEVFVTTRIRVAGLVQQLALRVRRT